MTANTEVTTRLGHILQVVRKGDGGETKLAIWIPEAWRTKSEVGQFYDILLDDASRDILRKVI